MRILVAEDSATQAEALKFILESEGWEVETVADGQSALARLYDSRFDLVLADATMPEMDGYTLCHSIRAEPAIRDVGFVLITGLDDPDSLVAALRAGVDGWFAKPLEIDRLLDAVREHLARAAEREHVRGLVRQLERRVAALESVRAHAPDGFAELESTARALSALVLREPSST